MQKSNITPKNASPTEQSKTYTNIRKSIISAQSKIYTAVNSAMVQAYWEIGEQIYIACGENERAEYGKGLLNFLSDKLTAEFGKGFTVSNLRNMRQFYLAFPKRYTVCSNLSRSHYRVLMRISDSKRRAWYTDECAESSASLQSYPRL